MKKKKLAACLLLLLLLSLILFLVFCFPFVLFVCFIPALSVFSFCKFPFPRPGAFCCLNHAPLFFVSFLFLFFMNGQRRNAAGDGFVWRCLKNIATKDHQSTRTHTFHSNISSRSTNTLDMRGIIRCFCPGVVWTSGLWGQRSRRGNCFKMATQKRACLAEVFYCSLKRRARLKAEKIRQKFQKKWIIKTWKTKIVLHKETQLDYISVLRIKTFPG